MDKKQGKGRRGQQMGLRFEPRKKSGKSREKAAGASGLRESQGGRSDR